MIKPTAFQWSAANFFGYYCAYGVVLPFLPVWLKSVGYDTEIIGLLLSLGYLFRFSGGLFFSSRIKQLNQLIPMSRKLAWGSLFAVVLMGFAADSFWLLFPAFGLFHLLNGAGIPMSDTIASSWQQQQGMDYAKARLCGSLAFVVGALLTGYIVGFSGESVILTILSATLLAFCMVQMLSPRVGFEEVTQKQAVSTSYWAVFKQPTTAKMLIIASLVQASHAAYYAYGSIYWQSIGISTQITSWLWGIAVIAEMGLFFIAKRIFGTQPLARLMLLSAIGTIIRWIIIANSESLPLIVFSQLLHACSYALNHYAIIRYISTQPSDHIPKLQGLYFGLASCAVMALFTLLAGFVYNDSPTNSFYLMAILVVPSFFLLPKKRAA